MTDEEIVEKAKKAEKKTGFGNLVHSPISKGVNSAFGIGFIEGMVEYRNSIQEEPVSESLGNAIGEYCSNPENFITYIDVGFKQSPIKKDDIPLIIKAIKFGAQWKEQQFEKNRLKHCDSITNEQAELEQGFIDQHLDKYQRMPTFIDAIEYGMRLQKEQIMKDALDAVVKIDAGGYPYVDRTIELYDYDKDIPLAKRGDKVKILVIKED